MTTKISGTEGVDLIKDGTVKQADLAANVVGNGPAFRVNGSGPQSVSDNVWTKCTLLTNEVFDTNNAFASSRFTPQVAGYYHFDGIITGGATAAISNIGAALYKNGFSEIAIALSSSVISANQSFIGGVIYLNGTTDYVELYGRVSGGTSGQSIGGANLSGCLVRAE